MLQGESEMAAFNKTLGKFQLVGIPPAPRGMPQIEVAFDIDANGIINVSAKDLGTGNEQQIRIEGGSGLKEDEVQQMIRDAEAHADEARRLRELADAKNQAESLVYETEKSLKEHRDKIAEADASTIEGRIMELQAGARGLDDAGEIRAKSDALSEASHKLAEAVYAQATASQASAPTGNGARHLDRRRGRRGGRLRGHRRGDQDLLMTEKSPTTNRAPDRARGAPSARRRARGRARRAERDEYLDALQRVAADFDNYRKRAAARPGVPGRAGRRAAGQGAAAGARRPRAGAGGRERTRGREARGGRRARAPRARRRARAGGPARDRDRRRRSTRTATRRCSRSPPTPTRAS